MSRNLSDEFVRQFQLQLPRQLTAQLRDVMPDLVRSAALRRVAESLTVKMTAALSDASDLRRFIAAAAGSQASLLVSRAVHDLDLLPTLAHPVASGGHDLADSREREEEHSGGIEGAERLEDVVIALPEVYAEWVLSDLRATLITRFSDLSSAGVTLPAPTEMADLLSAALPVPTAELDPHFADLAPFYNSDGASRQLGNITKQAVDSRRRSGTILAMQTGDGTWLYPAWQFTGNGKIHAALVPALRSLRGMDRWQAGVWLVSAHPDLDGLSPRQALSDGADPEQIAALATADRAASAA
ncbi:hypothetical protein [uncultured Nocardioides sp.]|uniref:hypothetical protein n=1 Tax=uncultured Nocardioides sp. TaxID=198441 RepID=UPI00260A2688|nr:hypothetical protein [uncultured Nocardioides sp.]